MMAVEGAVGGKSAPKQRESKGEKEAKSKFLIMERASEKCRVVG
jgi:hypothetical protein